MLSLPLVVLLETNAANKCAACVIVVVGGVLLSQLLGMAVL